MGAALGTHDAGRTTPQPRTAFQQVAERFGGAQGAAARFFKGECELNQSDYKEPPPRITKRLSRARQGLPDVRGLRADGKGDGTRGGPSKTTSKAANTWPLQSTRSDAKDPRHFDAAYSAVSSISARSPADAIKYFEMVAKDGTGDLKDRAAVKAQMLK
jgi:hypothetical protein